jgi:mannosyltransferase
MWLTRGSSITPVSLTQPKTEGSRAPGASPDSSSQPAASRALVVVGIIAVALGVVLRFVTRSPLWLDEALSVNIAELPLGDLPDALRRDGHPPLYYALLHGWMRLFGDGDVAARALSGLLSVMTLPLMWIVGRRRGGPVLAWPAVALLALAPFALRYATEVRMYALVMLLVLAGYLLIDDVVRAERAGLLRLVGIGGITALLVYSHYWSLWLLAATGLVMVWQAWRADDRGVRRRARQVVVALGVGGLLLLPWLGVMVYQAANTGTPWAGAQRPTSMIAQMLGDFGGGGFRDADLIGLVLAVAFLLGLFGRARSRFELLLNLRTERQFRYEAIVVGLTLGIGSAVAMLTGSAFASRYAAVIFPLFLLLVAGGTTRFATGWMQVSAVTVLLLASLGGAYFNVTDQRSQARDMARAIDGRADAGDLVVYCPDQLGPAGSRETRDDLDQVVYPTFAPPERIDWVDYAARHQTADPSAFASAAIERAGSDAAVFLVWNGSYRGVDEACEALVTALVSLRPAAEVIVPAGAGEYFEFSSVVYFPADP